MKKVLFCALNARYNHTNLAIRSLCTYGAKKLKERGLDGKLELRVKEQSINQSAEEIIRSIAEAFDGAEPDLLLFSVYIWNCSLTYTVAEAIKQIFPEMIIGFGGPEVSYQSNTVFAKCGAPSFIIKGEGERPVADILIKLAETESGGFVDALSSVKGLFFRNGSFSGDFLPVPLEDIPFVYANAPFEERADIKDCIVYYESSRGCPFNCAYCLSSIDKKVRTLPLERVLAEIDYFMAQGFRLIKFVDRTFNLKPSHYLKIWQYIIENHNGKTAFHFEIEARNLCQESFELLAKAPAGAIQFEAGIQSTNPETLKAVNRSPDVESIAKNIRRIPKNIHVHLDLIAGLPQENLISFGHSYDYVAALKGEQLQLGFLKVLSGAPIADTTKEPGWQFMHIPPYEVLQTPALPYRDILLLKDVETLTDIFYNSPDFRFTIRFITDAVSLFCFFFEFAHFINKNRGGVQLLRKTADWFALLAEFIPIYFSVSYKISPRIAAEFVAAGTAVTNAQTEEELQLTALYALEFLRFDYIRRAKTSTFAPWYVSRYDKNAHAEALHKHTKVISTRISYACSEYEEFLINPLSDSVPPEPEHTKILFLYAGKEKHQSKNYTTAESTRFIIL